MTATLPLMALLLVLPSGKEPPDALRDRVFDSWRARQDATRSVRFSWRREGTDAGAASDAAGGFVLDGARSRFWADCPHLGEGGDLFGENGYRGSTVFRRAVQTGFRAPHGIARPPRFERTSDGRETLESVDAGGAVRGTRRSRGVFGPTVAAVEALSGHPLLLLYRPFGDAGFAVDPSSCTLLAGTSTIDGVSCLVLDERRTVDGVEVRRRYWADPARGFVVLRMIRGRGGRDDDQIDIRYEDDAEHGPVPAWWHVMSFPDGPERFPGQRRLFRAAAFSVTDYAINPPVAGRETEGRLPEGAVVRDEASGRSYVVSRDGSRRYLQDREAVALSLSGGGAETGIGAAARYAASGLVAVAAVSLLWWRRRRVSSAAAPDGRTHDR